jgi:hypothetical protein
MQLYTITGKTDGFGSQYLAVMSGIALCEYHNFVYVHTPFRQFEHTSDVDTMNDFIGIQADTELDDIFKENMMQDEFSYTVHYSDNPNIYYTNKVIEMIRQLYYSSEKPEISDVDIAIHIRRGDVSETENENRYTDNKTYIEIINSLKEKYPTYRISIFSEGTFDDFKNIELEEKYFRLNEDITKTFHSLVTAKVLIMSKSAFSYSAAILNKNTIYYNDFWHKPLYHWDNIKSLISTPPIIDSTTGENNRK